MALKFRRGSTADKSGSLSFGEPYVNTTLTTLQVGGASGDITFTTQGNTSEHIALSVSASSFISASKLHITGDGEIKGNLVLGGNITIGDQTSDTVAVNANLSSSIIPSLTNTFDLGSVDKAWRDLYISTGSIKLVDPGSNTVVGTLTSNASGDFKVSGELSGSTIAGLGNAQTFSSSLHTRFNTLNSYTSSNNSVISTINSTTESLNNYTASSEAQHTTQNNRIASLEVESGSVRTTLNSYTSSANGRLNSLETESGSVRTDFTTFSSSIANSIQLTGSAVTIKGDLLVKGTTTTINSTTVNIDDNIIQLNGTGATNAGIIVRDATGGTTTSGSLLWDTSNDYWKAGPSANEDRIILGQEFYTFTSSNASTHTNHDGRLDSLETASGSINSFTASQTIAQNEQNVRLNTIENTTGSLNTYTASNDSTNATQNSKIGALETESGSVRADFNSYTASNDSTNATQNGRLDALQTSTGSINTFTSSASNRLSSLESTTASLNTYTASNDSANTTQNNRLTAIEISTGSLNSYTASNDSTNTTQNNKLSSLESTTASLNTFTSSINTTIKSKLDTEGVISGSSQVTISSTTGYSTFSSSIATTDLNQNNRLDSIQTSTASLNTFTSSINTTIKSKLDTEGVISGSSQITLSSTTGYTAYSASVATLNDSTNTALSTSIAVTNLAQNGRLDTIESRYATTGSNSFIGTQNITGSLVISQNLTVLGSSSLLIVTSSQLSVSASYISVNVFEPAERFGGLKVYDSGSLSHQATASLLWDSQQNHWIYQNASGSTYSGGMLLSGPRNTGSLGEEVGLTSGKIAKSVGGDHLDNSIMNESSGVIYVTGSVSATGTVGGTNITAIETATSSLNTYTSSYNSSTATLTNKTISGASNTLSNIANASLTNSSITIAGVSTALGGTISAATIGNAIGAFSGSSQITTLPSVDTDDLTEGATNKYYTDARVKTKLSAEGVISGSSQITTLPSVDTDDLTEGVTNKYYTDTRVKTKLSAEGVISGSSQVFSNVSGDVLIASNGVATIQANSVVLGTDTTGNYVASLVAGTNITLSNNSGEGATPTIGLTNNAITIAGTSTSLGGTISAATIGNAIGAFSGSSQVDHNATTNYDSNKHIDHTAVSISAGLGLSGGGTIAASRTLSIDTAITATVTGSQTLTNKTISGASNTLSNIANASLTNSSVTVTAGTGLSGGGAVSLGSSVTLTNAGVTSNVAGTGISVSGATGAVTITNTGVTSAVAGTGVGVSAGTGAVTISIGQAVATSSNVQFNSLGVGMAASATAGRIDATNDIVAYSSSDRRFKDNIKPIENPLEKISKISGNTFDWKEENKVEHGYEGNDVGVIAQEIEAVLPQLVQTRESGYKAVKYDKLVALLIEGIKEQQIQINDMKVEIENLKRQKGL